MLKRIFIFINLFILMAYSASSLTTYLSNKGEDRSYKIYESRFNELQEKLEKKDSLITGMSEKDISSFSEFIVESEKKNDEDIKPRFMQLFHEKTTAFSKELAKKKIVSGIENKREVKITDKNTMDGYLEEARNKSFSKNNDDLHYFVKTFINIQNSFDGYVIKTPQSLLSSFFLYGFIILVFISMVMVFYIVSEDTAPDIEDIVIPTYMYCIISIIVYIVYLLVNWLTMGV